MLVTPARFRQQMPFDNPEGREVDIGAEVRGLEEAMEAVSEEPMEQEEERTGRRCPPQGLRG